MPYWYRQNTFVYVARGALDRVSPALRDAVEAGPRQPLRAVHPALFDEKRHGHVGGLVHRLGQVGRGLAQTLAAHLPLAT